jgi:hypothetical protein
MSDGFGDSGVLDFLTFTSIEKGLFFTISFLLVLFKASIPCLVYSMLQIRLTLESPGQLKNTLALYLLPRPTHRQRRGLGGLAIYHDELTYSITHHKLNSEHPSLLCDPLSRLNILFISSLTQTLILSSSPPRHLTYVVTASHSFSAV